ncbi:MAG: DNA repair protein RecN [Candidatus Kapabacteria bacterium]|nr:DNA repair protein RecN [Ignavibacteriota bacterium]MCW5884633.1 DNA repair protein RecN [Candidatus Kapabacteria bacterium]
MINNLYIKDFALIENLTLDLSSGLNIVIGETGSGKSMIIDALIIIFGGRASSDYVRRGASKAIIEVNLTINGSDFGEILKEPEIEFDNELIIRREISAKGNTRNFINDTPVNLNLIKSIGDLFIDFHGQHDHQSLLNPANQIDIFDKSAGLEQILNSYRILYLELKSEVAKFNHLVEKEQSLKDKLEIQKFKFDEINKVNPLVNEDNHLYAELKLLENSEIRFSLSSELYDLLYDSELSVLNNLAKANDILNKLGDIDNTFNEFQNEINSSLISIKEISQFSNSYKSSIVFNPEKIEEIRLRLLQLKGLQKKYGSIEKILEMREELENEIILAENFDDEKKKFIKRINELKSYIFIEAKKIEELRTDYSNIFSRSIESGLYNLGINNAKFEVRISRLAGDDISDKSLVVNDEEKSIQLLSNGINNVEFYLSTNLGEDVKPLKQVASGGEISRIMLTIKNILAEKDNISCLVFDEIDTGVSGRIAGMVASAMSELAKYHQIIAISHLPQIAAKSDKLILVHKFEDDTKTYSEAKILSNSEKITEIAKMMSGNEITAASIENAEQLLKN